MLQKSHTFIFGE